MMCIALNILSSQESVFEANFCLNSVKCVSDILKDADLTTMSAKKVREEIEAKLDCDLTSR